MSPTTHKYQMLVRTTEDVEDIKANSVLAAEPTEMDHAILQTPAGDKYVSPDQFELLVFDRFDPDRAII